MDTNISSQPTRDQPRKRYGQQTDCSICTDDIKYEVETNCGHTFCCQCWINHVTHLNVVGRIHCPLCRQKVNILYQCFSEAELNPPRNSENVGEVDKFLQEIKHYNERNDSEPRTTLTGDRDSDSENYTDIDSDDDSDNYTDIDTESDTDIISDIYLAMAMQGLQIFSQNGISFAMYPLRP